MPAPAPNPTLLAAADRFGLFGSMVCAVHCALMPLVFGLLPALGLGLFGNADFDQAFTVFASVLGVTTLSVGFRRHRAFHAWMLLVPGLLLIWLGSFTVLHDHSLVHWGLMTAGAALVAFAHLVNLRLSHGRGLRLELADSEPG